MFSGGNEEEYSGAVAHYTQKTVSKVIKEWYVYTLKRKILIQIEEYLRSKYINKLLSIVIKEWFEHSLRESLNRVRAEYISDKRRRNAKNSYFAYWYYDYYLGRREIYKKYRSLKKNTDRKLVRDAYYAWSKEFEFNCKSADFERKRLLRNSLQVWCTEHIRLNELYNEFIKRRRIRIFLQYYDYYLKKSSRDRLLMEKCKLLEHSLVNRIFGQWMVLVKYSMSKRYNILQWQIKTANNRIIAIINQWRYYIVKRSTSNRIYEALKLNYEMNTKSRIFSLWLSATHNHYREKTLLIISGLTARKHLLLRGFNSLVKYVQQRRESKLLKIKSQLVLVCYIIRLFLRNSNDYCKCKSLVYNTSRRIEIGRKSYYWKAWRRYVYSRGKYRHKQNQLISKFNMNTMYRVYRIWSYVCYKTTTNRMIIECINMKINKNLKKRVFYSIYYSYLLVKTRFWEVFVLLINNRKRLFVGKLYENMLVNRKRECLENQIADKIKLGILFKGWKRLTYENKVVLFVQNKFIIKRSLESMIKYAIHTVKFDNISDRIKQRLVLNVIGIWKMQSRKRRNVLRILENYGGVHKIGRILAIRPYFSNWVRRYRQISGLVWLCERVRKNSLRLCYMSWRSKYTKHAIDRERFSKIQEQVRMRRLGSCFINWATSYNKNRAIRSRGNKLSISVYLRKVETVWRMLKTVSEARSERRCSIRRVFFLVEISIKRYSWNLLKEALSIERTFEKISHEYKSYIDRKRLMLIYNHWRQLFIYIMKIKSKESISRTYYYTSTLSKCWLLWRDSYANIKNTENAAESYVINGLRVALMRNIFKGWENMTRISKKACLFRGRTMLATKRRVFYGLIFTYNKYVLYKKRVLECVNVEYINSYLFKLQYNRVMSDSRQIGMTLNTSLLMYQDHNVLKVSICKWIRVFYTRIQYKSTVMKESDRLCQMFKYVNKREAFLRMTIWRRHLNQRFEIIVDFKRKNTLKNCLDAINRAVSDSRFTMNISDALYRSCLMKKISKGLNHWRIYSKHKALCRGAGELLRDKVNTCVIRRVFCNWMQKSCDYLKYFLLAKHSLRPYKLRYLRILKCYSFFVKIQERGVLTILASWHDFTLRKRNLELRLENYSANILFRNAKRRFMSVWMTRYRQKKSSYDLYKKVNVWTPMRNAYKEWLLRTRERTRMQEQLMDKIRKRQKMLAIRAVRLSHRIMVLSRKGAGKMLSNVYRSWRLLSESRKELRRRRIKKCLLAWREHVRRRIQCTSFGLEIAMKSIEGRRRCYYQKMIQLYRKRVSLKQIKLDIMNRIRLKYLFIWRKSLLNIARISQTFGEINTKRRRRVVFCCFERWRRRYSNRVSTRMICEAYADKRRIRVLSLFYERWRINLVPHRYIRSGRSMINVLNKVHIHSSFHKLLMCTYYPSSSRSNLLNEDRWLSVQSIYFTECRCTLRTIMKVKEGRFEWILRLFSFINKIKKYHIEGTILRLMEYSRLREQYHSGFERFELVIRRTVLSRIWFIYKANSIVMSQLRNGVRRIRDRAERRVKLVHLAIWVNRYNLSKRNEAIIRRMSDSYNRNVIVKCYLIWCIKYHKNIRKRTLSEKAVQFQALYILRHTLNKFNEYLLYSKWQIWCKKAHDTIDWVSKFRLKSSCFLVWRSYTTRQKASRRRVMAFYDNLVIKIIRKRYFTWRNEYIRIKKGERVSENYYNFRFYKKVELVFESWRDHSLLIRNMRNKLVKYVHLRNRKVLFAYFRLWKFFNYYKKTRDERFQKITNLIISNHNRTMAYRIFYSWKLKMIESLSLKNSIFLSWKVNQGSNGDTNSLSSSRNGDITAREVLISSGHNVVDGQDDPATTDFLLRRSSSISSSPPSVSSSPFPPSFPRKSNNTMRETLFSSSSSSDKDYWDVSFGGGAYKVGVNDPNDHLYYDSTSHNHSSNRRGATVLSDGDLEIDELDSIRRKDGYDGRSRLNAFGSRVYNDKGEIEYQTQPQILLETEREEGGRISRSRFADADTAHVGEKIIIHNVISDLPDIQITNNPYELVSLSPGPKDRRANTSRMGRDDFDLFSPSSSSPFSSPNLGHSSLSASRSR